MVLRFPTYWGGPLHWGRLISAEQADEFRSTANRSALNILGPNCMGFINLTDSTVLYPAKTTSRLKAGESTLIAQSGSAAITVMNSANFGFSKIITVGSAFQLSSVDYLKRLATDNDTTTIGVMLESILDPAGFAEAVAPCFANNKALVVLKVGQSKVGSAATLAHTGAMTSDAQTYDVFFERHGIPAVTDYDELAVAMECLSKWGQQPSAVKLAVAGVSGGQTTLACDIAEQVGVTLAEFGTDTQGKFNKALLGADVANPIDFGAVVDKSTRD